jgi:hypothetical protein
LSGPYARSAPNVDTELTIALPKASSAVGDGDDEEDVHGFPGHEATSPKADVDVRVGSQRMSERLPDEVRDGDTDSRPLALRLEVLDEGSGIHLDVAEDLGVDWCRPGSERDLAPGIHRPLPVTAHLSLPARRSSCRVQA